MKNPPRLPDSEDNPHAAEFAVLDALRAENEAAEGPAAARLAEMENVRRIAAREKAEASLYAVTKFARDMLGIADNFARALAACPAAEREAADPQIKAVLDGIEATDRVLISTLEQHGVKLIDTGRRQVRSQSPPGDRGSAGQRQAAGQHRGCGADRLSHRRPPVASGDGDGGARRKRACRGYKSLNAERGQHHGRPEFSSSPAPPAAWAARLIREIAQGSGITLCGALEAGRSSQSGHGFRHRCRACNPTASSWPPIRLPVIAQAQGIVDFTNADGVADAGRSRRPGPHCPCHRHHRFQRQRRRADQGRRPSRRHRQVRQYEHGRQSAGGAGGKGGPLAG